MEAKKFGSFIQQRRKELGLTQTQLGERIAVTAKAVSRWERGIGFPDIHLLEPLAEALEVTVIELMRSERMPEESITVEEAGTIVTDSLRMAQEQERFKVRGRLLKFLGIPAVYLFMVGMVYVINNHTQLSMFHRCLIGLVVFLFGSYVIRGIRYIADCQYLEEPKKINWLSAALTFVSCVGVVVTIFSFFLNTDGLRQYYAPAVGLGMLLTMAWPIYGFIRLCREKPEEETE